MQHLLFTFVKWINPSSSSFMQISSTILSCWPLLYNIMNKLHIHQDSFDVTVKIKCHLERTFSQCLAQWRNVHWVLTMYYTYSKYSKHINNKWFLLWVNNDILKYVVWIFHGNFFQMSFSELKAYIFFRKSMSFYNAQYFLTIYIQNQYTFKSFLN